FVSLLVLVLTHTSVPISWFSLLVSPLLFYFYYNHAHRHLHSFPTRRSSDLTSRSICTPGARTRSACTSNTSATPFSAMRCMAPRDRKSTRLNSSHVAISYAVFCLKKK